MTVKDVFELRKQGRIEEAYNAIRPLYVNDKGAYTSTAMFWTATDILKKRLDEGRTDEAEKIFVALERMLPNVPDKEGLVERVFKKCQKRIKETGVVGDKQKGGVPEHLQTGIWGEELAVDYLRDKGYVILERDWHSGHRDIDIIAQQDDTIVFVEVKTRSSRDFIDPVMAVNSQKQHNLLIAINHYLQYNHVSSPYRFDVITIVGTPGCLTPEIEHIEDFMLAQPSYSGGRRWR